MIFFCQKCLIFKHFFVSLQPNLKMVIPETEKLCYSNYAVIVFEYQTK